MSFPYDQYSKWIHFRELDIYNLLIKVYTDTNPPSMDPQEQIDIQEFFDSIWKNVELINNGLNSTELDYLLFTHLLLLNIEYIDPKLFKKYDLSNKLVTPLNYISSTSDGSTSVSSNIMGEDTLNMGSSFYLLTKWGYMYYTLLQQIQSMIVIL